MNTPTPGSKPAPCTPEEATALAKQKADTAEISLVRYYAMATQLGVYDVRMCAGDDGIVISLRGVIEKRNVSVDVLCPVGQPFALYAMTALEEYKRGITSHLPLPEFVEREIPAGTPIVDGETGETIGKSSEPTPMLTATIEETRTAEGKIDHIKIETHLDDRVPQDVTPEERQAFDKAVDEHRAAGGYEGEWDRAQQRARAAKAAELATQPVKHGNITKPAPAGAGQRKPLSLPLCKQCKAQPVYTEGAEFCGGACAKQWHMNSVAQTQGVKLP